MPEQPKHIVLKAKGLVDGTGAPMSGNVAILITDGVIHEIGNELEVISPPGAKEIDLGDKTLMPGMVDAHMHFMGRGTDDPWDGPPTQTDASRALRAAGEARKMLEAGVTAARCLGSAFVGPSLRRAIEDGHVPGPRMVAAGHFICSTYGTWDHINVPLEWVKAGDMLADGVEGMRAIVRRRIRQGANVIKVGLSKGIVGDRYLSWGEDPLKQVGAYSLEEVRALTDEAHRNKLKVSAHCIGDEAIRLALASNVDTIEHGYGITDETRRMLVDHNALVVSTICQILFHARASGPYNYPEWRKQLYHRHLEILRRDFEKSLAAGVRYALGTDLGGYPTHPQDLAAKEFELAVEWGMDPMQAISAGTMLSAEAMSMGNVIGTIETGKYADIIAVLGDPIRDITALQHVQFVMQGGEVVRNSVNTLAD